MNIEKLKFNFEHLELKDIDAAKCVEPYYEKINEIIDHQVRVEKAILVLADFIDNNRTFVIKGITNILAGNDETP